MAAKDHHYPRKGNIPLPMVYSTLDRFGDPKHTLYGGKTSLGGCQSGAGTWWPDYHPTQRDFSAAGKNHPTECVFQNEVIPYTNALRSQSSPDLIRRGSKNRAVQEAHERPIQFRHPIPAREALYKSVNNMPSKPGGRRKCAEASNWKAALSTGREGYKHGGRMPIWCKGPFLEDPDFHQLHPLKRDEDTHTISTTCRKEQMAAGAATGTCPVDALLLTSKTSQALGMKDSQAIRAEMTFNAAKDLSHSRTFKAASMRLNGEASPASASRMVSSVTSLSSDAAIGEERLPNWVATQTIASRDPQAAGGQAGPTALRRAAISRCNE